MGNEKNLRRLDTETAREIGRKGAKVTNEIKRKKKTIRETLEIMLAMKPDKKLAMEIAKASGLPEKSITFRDAMTFLQIHKAIKKQDTQAFNAVVDRVDGKPEQISKIGNIDGEEFNGNINVKFIRNDIDEC